jgi:hypothetical protein
MFTKTKFATTIGALAALLTACQPPRTTDFGDVSGVEEIAEPLAPLGDRSATPG